MGAPTSQPGALVPTLLSRGVHDPTNKLQRLSGGASEERKPLRKKVFQGAGATISPAMALAATTSGLAR